MLIEKEAALQAVHKAIAEGTSWYSALSHLPSTELVRCRECVMWDDSLVLNGKKKCLNMSFCTDGDFYCGWGSRE